MNQKTKSKTEKELKEIAIGIVDNKIFCQWHIRPEDASMIGSIFMPLMLMSSEELGRLKKEDLGMAYEYMNEKGYYGINGYPTFMSVRFLTEKDTDKVRKYVDEYEKVRKEFLTTPKAG